MNSVAKILTVVLLASSIGLFVYLYGSVQKVIDDRNAIAGKESAVIERLKLIREAEIVFLEVNGRYTANWDSLINFIETGRVPIVERREVIEQLAYGGEKVTLETDTLGFISAKERIFKRNYTLNASDNGTFGGFKVKVGDQVIRNQKGYVLKVGDRESEPPFTEKGKIDSLASINVGDPVSKGQILIAYWDYIFDINTDLTSLGNKPQSTEKFEIFVGKVDKAGVMVQVVEVKDPTPDNPARKETNEQKNRKPLRFGSRTDVSTAGNWE
jgi:hypothetical protein